MFSFLFQLSDIKLFFLLSIVIISFSIVLIYALRKLIKKEVQPKNNAVIGYVSSLIGIIYGVFVGLMALYLLNNITYASNAVLREAGAATNIYRDSKLLTTPERAKIQSLIKSYVKQVVNVEWPQMSQAKRVDKNGYNLIEQMTNELVRANPKSSAADLLIHDMLDSIKILYESRENRIQISYSQLNGDIWFVIILSTLLIILMNFLYVMEFSLHIILLITVALITSSMTFLLITLDRPFQGEFVVEPRQFELLLGSMTDVKS